MNKEISLQLKGIAILMMLFLHLFNQLDQVYLCHTSINFWNNKPLVYALSRVCAFCVPIYLFLSGYGLSFVYDKQKGEMHTYKRIWKLLLNYWIVIALFIPMGAYLVPQTYPGNWETFLSNTITWKHSYNAEWWFLFPYLLLVLISPKYLKFIFQQNEKQSWLFMGVMTLLYFGTYSAHKIWRTTFDSYYILEQLKQGIYCLYSFSWGAIFYRNCFLERTKAFLTNHPHTKNRTSLLAISGIILIFLLRMMLGPSIINPLFVIVFLILYNNLRLPLFLCQFLRFMSHHSTNMWLVHTFFAYYYFHDFIYGLRYPLLMYIVLILVSLLTSYIIHFLMTAIMRITKLKS